MRWTERCSEWRQLRSLLSARWLRLAAGYGVEICGGAARIRGVDLGQGSELLDDDIGLCSTNHVTHRQSVERVHQHWCRA